VNRRKAEVLNMVLRYKFPLDENCLLDLYSAFDFLKKNLGSVSFEPENNFKSLWINFLGVKFQVFSSGTSIIYGLKLDKFENIDEIMNLFWCDYLHQFIKKKSLGKVV